MEEIVCNLEMEDLLAGGSCANNSKGVKVLHIALHRDVAKFPTLPKKRVSYEDFAVLSEGGVVSNGIANSLKMKTGKNFFKFFCSKDLGELTYTPQGVTGQKSMSANLEVVHPGIRSKILGFLGATMNEELVIICKLNNGDVHLLGDKDRGCEYGDTVTAASGKAAADQTGVTINFVYDCPTAQIYIGDVDGLLANNEENTSGSGS